MDVDTSNIGVQITTENKGDCNNQEAATNEVQLKEVGLNLMSNATKNAEGTPRVGVDATGDSVERINGFRTKNNEYIRCQDVKNFGKDVLQVENENPTKNSDTVKSGPTENFHDEKRQDTSNASRDLFCSIVLMFYQDYWKARKNESSALVSNTIDLGEDSLDEDGVDLGEDSLDEDEEDNMLDTCFDRVAREGDISPRQQEVEATKVKRRHMEGNIVGMVAFVTSLGLVRSLDTV
ncbi:hypothetical protein H5410_043556 [Solanum commersonii]|uniref:Uncharacterized protein n=1 Tax=Solanum commersonii TaxID=4109 RepID=A0A9J5XZ69_SOLCO|nr:hypothetical protein H5410_043556 [Solanum commersonii]